MSSSSHHLSAVLDQVDAQLDTSLQRLMALMRIPSISNDPAHASDCDRAADWLVTELSQLGFRAEKHLTPAPGLPMVRAWSHTPAAAKPHVLFYGHYDVQPVDPLELWEHNPFVPEIRQRPAGQAICGRGAADDKGQLLTLIEACRAWLAVYGQLPLAVAMLFEGEEEAASQSLEPYLREHVDDLRTADIALICDTNLFDSRIPAIITQLRGLLAEEIIVTGANQDLHSGTYGGAVLNPARVLTRILADLHGDQGQVTLAGFYDGVSTVSDLQQTNWEGLGFSTTRFLGEVGLRQPAGERGRHILDMLWSRPTLEINGLESGYTGSGFKTVLPAQARAKISCRLVGQQNPERIRAALHEHVRARLPEDASVEFIAHAGAPATVVATNHPAVAAARHALSEEWGQPAVLIGCGGSIPIAGHFQDILGLESLLIGFGRDDDRIHSPNEQFLLNNFHKGIRSWVRILDALARSRPDD